MGLVSLVLAGGLVALSSPGAGAQQRSEAPEGLVWLALGDSYSSGEGLPYVDVDANPDGATCERATGENSVPGGEASQAYAKVAYDQLRGSWVDSRFELLACTGALSNGVHDQTAEWSGQDGRPADLVTISMGGNNLGFADLIRACVGVDIENVSGGLLGTLVRVAVLGCDVSADELKLRVIELVGRGRGNIGPDGGQTLPDMYRELVFGSDGEDGPMEGAVKQGGHVVVLGYPQIFEESGRWGGWRSLLNRCQRMRRADVSMIREVTAFFNEQLALMVGDLNEEGLGVTFHWLDVSAIYENDSGRHGLCSSDEWLNGITVGATGPDTGLIPFRLLRSFHPNQAGHTETGKALAELISNEINWSTDPCEELVASQAPELADEGTEGVFGIHCAAPFAVVAEGAPHAYGYTIYRHADNAWEVLDRIESSLPGTFDLLVENGASETVAAELCIAAASDFGFDGLCSPGKRATPLDCLGAVGLEATLGRVDEFANVRSAASFDAAILDTIDRGKSLLYDPDSRSSSGGRDWLRVFDPSGRSCGYVAADLLKDEYGVFLGPLPGDLRSEVAATIGTICALADANDLPGLISLAESSPDFTATFGGPQPLSALWAPEDEIPQIVSQLCKQLPRPAGSDIVEWASGDQFGWRIGIDPNGVWRYLIAGD